MIPGTSWYVQYHKPILPVNSNERTSAIIPKKAPLIGPRTIPYRIQNKNFSLKNFT